MDFTQLPEDIVEKIVTEHLETPPQLTAFSGVCKSWRTTAHRLHGGRPLCLPGLFVSKATASQSSLEAYYNSGQIHEFYPLTTFCSTTLPSRTPRATLPFLPSPSKISDALGQRHRYLRRHHDLVTSFHDYELAASIDPPYSDDPDNQSSSDENDEDDYDYYYDDYYDEDSGDCARSLGSKDGWILRTLPHRGERGVSHQPRALDLYLLNPITGASIPLPPLKSSSPADIFKAIITSSPDDDSEECHVFILSRSDPLLAWCNVSSQQLGQGWNFTSKDSYIFFRPHDAAYFGGKLYVVDRCSVYAFDHELLLRLSSSSSSSSSDHHPTRPVVRAFPFSRAMTSFPDDYDSCCENYTAERTRCHHLCHLDGELHVILRSCNMFPLRFQVYKLIVSSSSSGGYYWREVRSLDGRAVFVGPHQSFVLPAKGVRGNCIYFGFGLLSWHSSGCGAWNGVFDLTDQEYRSFALDRRFYRKSRDTFWFLPMPWDISKLHNRHRKKKKKKACKRETLLGTTTNETEYWTLPKKTIKNHHHQHLLDSNNNNNVTRNNRFQALLSDADDEDEED